MFYAAAKEQYLGHLGDGSVKFGVSSRYERKRPQLNRRAATKSSPPPNRNRGRTSKKKAAKTLP